MSLVSTIESLQGRPLSKEETASLAAFQKHFHIDDDDPLIAVLAMMARSQLILESAPELLQQKVRVTIELHQQVLREQAVLISKELIEDLSQHIAGANALRRGKWIPFAAGVLVGIVVVAGIFVFAMKLIR